MKITEILRPEQMVKSRPPAGVLASYTDQDGYTVRIEGLRDDPAGAGRFGTMYVSDGKRSVKTGYWMNYPEKAWKISERQWQSMSWRDRAAMEVKQQATAYRGLKDQFAFWATRQADQEDQARQVIARKWDTGQNLTRAEANILKTMLRAEFHQQIDARTADGNAARRADDSIF